MQSIAAEHKESQSLKSQELRNLKTMLEDKLESKKSQTIDIWRQIQEYEQQL